VVRVWTRSPVSDMLPSISDTGERVHTLTTRRQAFTRSFTKQSWGWKAELTSAFGHFYNYIEMVQSEADFIELVPVELLNH